MINKILNLLIVISFIFFLTACGEEEKPIDIYSRLQDVSRLELARMTVGKVGMITDPEYKDASTLEAKANVLLNTMKIGSRIGVYSYDTYLVAYIDLSKIASEDIEIDQKNGVAHVTLPPVEIMTDGREPQLHEEHVRVSGLRSSITPSERAALKAQMSRELRKEIAADANSAKLLKEAAESKAKLWFSQLLENWGYTPDISFKTPSHKI